MNESPRPLFRLDALRDVLRRVREQLPERLRPGKDVEAERLRAQVAVIRRAFREKGLLVLGAPVEGAEPCRDDADIHFLYRPGHAVVREEDLPRLREYFGRVDNVRRFRGGVKGRTTRVPGLVLAQLPQRLDGRDDVLATIEELERGQVVERGAVGPDHVVYVTPRGYLCPASEPEIPAVRRGGVWPPPAKDEHRGKVDPVRVAVVDTGLWTDAVTSPVTPWLSGVVADPSDVEVVDPDDIHPYAGHGTFAAGVIRCIAPGTRVEVEGVLTHGGAVFETEIVEQLHEAINDCDDPQVISISAGTHTRGDFRSVAFEVLGRANKLGDRDDVLIVAAAGNDASDRPFWPAAFDWVVGVGSVDPDGSVSDFSNVGETWVDVYARGRDVVNAFPRGTYRCYEPPNVGQVRTFDGLAQWSGTSFSTPIVAGLVAARMRETGETAHQAWASVLSGATDAIDPRGGQIKVVGPLT